MLSCSNIKQQLIANGFSIIIEPQFNERNGHKQRQYKHSKLELEQHRVSTAANTESGTTKITANWRRTQ